MKPSTKKQKQEQDQKTTGMKPPTKGLDHINYTPFLPYSMAGFGCHYSQHPTIQATSTRATPQDIGAWPIVDHRFRDRLQHFAGSACSNKAQDLEFISENFQNLKGITHFLEHWMVTPDNSRHHFKLVPEANGERSLEGVSFWDDDVVRNKESVVTVYKRKRNHVPRTLNPEILEKLKLRWQKEAPELIMMTKSKNKRI